MLDIIPRVVHPNDIKTRVIHVAGQEGHYVCGVSGIEKDETFTLQKIPRKSFYTYPEEALGLLVGFQSAQSCGNMWRVCLKTLGSWSGIVERRNLDLSSASGKI